MSHKGARKLMERSCELKDFSHQPLQNVGLEGRTVPWKGGFATILNAGLQGKKARIGLKLNDGNTITVTAEEIEDEYRKAGLL